MLQVANFGTFEEDEETVEKSIDGNSKSERTWEDIIPEKERQKLAEEEEHLKRMELFLPPRKRKKVEKVCKILSIYFLPSNFCPVFSSVDTVYYLKFVSCTCYIGNYYCGSVGILHRQ